MRNDATDGNEREGLRARSRRGRIGRTWWSGRWTEVLESIGLGDRLHRGRSLARAGKVLSLEIRPGEAIAEVKGNRQELHDVRIAMTPIAAESWDALEEILARRALFAARLLAGEIPLPIEEAFAEAGLSLFPKDAGELEADCGCADPARPCPHAAAVFYLMAERFDRDPFDLFLFRGCGRDALIAGIRESSGQIAAGTNGAAHPAGPSDPDGAASRSVARGPAGQGTGVAETEGADPAAAAAEDAPAEQAEDFLNGYWSPPGDLDEVQPRIMPPPIPQAVLRRLGPPPSAAHDSPAEAALYRAYQIAAEWALKTAIKPE